MKYETRKSIPVILAIAALWFGLGAFAAFNSAKPSLAGSVIFVFIAILCLFLFIKSLKIYIRSDEVYVYFNTIIKNTKIQWVNIKEIKTKYAKSGLAYILIGQSDNEKTETINLGILIDKKQFIRQVIERNPAVTIDKRIKL